MKVLYDHQAFTIQEHGGVSRYFYELMNRYGSSGEPEFELPLKFSNNSYISEWRFKKHKSFFRGLSFRGKARLLTLLNKRSSISALKRSRFDVFHPTYYDPYFLEYCSKPFVLTIYDMIHEKFPEYFHGRDHVCSAHKRLLCEKAGKIIAISQNTKNDLIEMFNIPADKIEVIYLGNSIYPGPSSELKLPEKYMLFVGMRGGYKNFKCFITAASGILKKRTDLCLVCAGGGGFSKEESDFLKDSEIEEQVRYFPVTESSLAHIYKNAVCFVFPSIYEGFGLPVLEAFACGCPALLSRASCFPEIAADAAVYFDPSEPEEIAEAVVRILDSGELRAELALKGAERLKFFSWNNCANRTLEVYKSVV